MWSMQMQFLNGLGYCLNLEIWLVLKFLITGTNIYGTFVWLQLDMHCIFVVEEFTQHEKHVTLKLFLGL